MFIEKIREIRATSAVNRKIPIYRSSVPRIKGNQGAMLAITFAAVVLGALNISAARAEVVSEADQGLTYAQSAPSGQGERGGRPPREALEACANVEPQSACEFSGRDGKSVQGTCMSPKSGVPLACVPANMPKQG